MSYIHLLNLGFYFCLLFIVFFGMRQLLFLLGADNALEDMVKHYLYPCAVGMIFLMISTGWNAAVRNLGAPRYAFFSMMAGALCNIVFD